MKFSRWLLLILALALALRLYQVSTMALRADEASNLFFASQDLGAILKQLATDDPHPPLYFILLHFWVSLAGDSELALRFLGSFAGTLIVALVYLLGKILFPRETRLAIIASALVAINPSLIWDAQDAHLYPFLVLLSAISFAAFLLAMRRGSPARWALYAAASALALYVHYLAAFILVAQAAMVLWGFLRGNVPRRTLIGWLAAQLFTAAIFLPWFLLAGNLLGGYRTDFFPPANFLEILARSLAAFSVGRVDDRVMPPMVEPRVGWAAAFVFLAIFLFGLARSKDRAGLITLPIYLFVPLASFAIFSRLRFPIYDERYVLYLAPAFSLLVACGIRALDELPKAGIVAGAAVLFIVLASAQSLYNYWYVPAFAKSPDWQGFVGKIFSESRSGDVLIQNYPDPALPYYLKNRVPRVLLPRSSGQNVSDLNADLVRLTTRYDRVWLQPVPNSTWDAEGLVVRWLMRHAREIRAYDVRGSRLELYLTATTALRDAKPIGALFADRVQLIAYDLDSSKPQVLTLYWQAREKLNRDYTVFVHLYSSDGKLIAQKDATPVNGTFPTTQWEANATIVDGYEIAIPRDAPSGILALMVGMYDSQTQTRLPVVDRQGNPFPENRVRIAEVTRE